MAKRSTSAPMVTQPIRLSAAQPMAENTSGKKRQSRVNKMDSAKAELVRQKSLGKQRSLLAGAGKNVKNRMDSRGPGRARTGTTRGTV
jgi:hypothetical protein